MSVAKYIDGIGQFTPSDERDLSEWARLQDFVTRQPRAFTRDPLIGGHVTGSAAILSPQRDAMLLTHHAKLDRWLQLGGHCDGIRDLRFVALKEAYEESGLEQIFQVQSAVLDIDIHDIPANAKEPAHLHYDVRFLFQATSLEFKVSAESKALAWVPLGDLERYSTAASVLRLRDKIGNAQRVQGS